MKRNFIAWKVSVLLISLILSSLSEVIPHDVLRLKNQRDQAVKEIDSKYRADLEKLKAKYTKLGNLEVANSIVKMIESLNADSLSGDAPMGKKVVGEWKFDYKGKSRVIDLKSNFSFVGQKIKDAQEFSGKWSIEGNKITLWGRKKKIKYPQYIKIVSSNSLIFVGPVGAMTGTRK